MLQADYFLFDINLFYIDRIKQEEKAEPYVPYIYFLYQECKHNNIVHQS